jgi:hypothetical protein
VADRPDFRVCVVGTCPDPGFVDRKLGELLRRKIQTHRVTVYAGGDVALPAFLFADRYQLATERIRDPEDELGSFRNAGLLNTCSAFVAFGHRADWPRDVRDLVLRAEVSGMSVRVIA